jgi:hypothetical protein
MEFVETSIFTKKLPMYLSDDEYRKFQQHLEAQPTSGDVIKGSGGIRKIRWKAEGRGKSGGVRIIYYLEVAASQFLLLTLYAKNELEDLTQAEIKLLKKIVENWNNG